MNEQNNLNYHQQAPQGPMMPPQPPMDSNRQLGMPRRRMGWRERWMKRFGMDAVAAIGKGELTIPNWLTGKSMAFFFVAMFVCWFAFGYVPDFALWAIAAISVVLFFYGGQAMSRSWERKKTKKFLRNIFVAGLAIRLIWVLYCYYYFNPEYYGNTYGETADVEWYIPFAKDLTQWLLGDSKYSLSELIDINNSAIDDVGYPMWLGLVYLIVGVDNEIFIPFLFKCIFSAYCAISIYHIAKRHFEEGVARMAAIFVCVSPNMVYWCGNMFKETEMVFLCCLAIDNFDRVLNSGQRYTFRSLLPGMIAAIVVFFFRAPLAILIFLSVFAHIVMVSKRVMSLGKKILASMLVFVVLAVSMGDRIWTQSRALVETVQSSKQQTNMEWRAERKDGSNSFAKYAGAAVFAPLIFTIPFPTFNKAEEGQRLQVQLSGGSYIKNVFSFFVIIVMLMLLISSEWRRHVFVLAYTVGYNMELVMSNFAQSGRFHMPVMPMLMLFAAYGIQIAKTNGKVKRWFPIVLVIEVAACLAWNWYKLAGRGMI